MARAKRIEGVLAPVITPFRKDYAPDAERFVRHCRWLLKNGCSGLAVFGTNSEANSMSVPRAEEHTSELQSQFHLVCRLLLEKKKRNKPFNDEPNSTEHTELMFFVDLLR